MANPGRIVEIVEYDPLWAELFEVERRLLVDVLPTASSIEHIGSTSVPGLAAKPIIDVLAVVPDVAVVAASVPAVERLGYAFRPWVFADDAEHLFFVKDTDGTRTQHLHVFGVASPHPRANRLFRDYVAAQPEAARRYEAAKRLAADAHPDSRRRYNDAKAAIMTQLQAEAGLWDGRRS